MNGIASPGVHRTIAKATKRSPGLGRIFAGADDWIRLGHTRGGLADAPPIGGDTGTLASHAASSAFVSATSISRGQRRVAAYVRDR